LRGRSDLVFQAAPEDGRFWHFAPYATSLDLICSDFFIGSARRRGAGCSVVRAAHVVGMNYRNDQSNRLELYAGATHDPAVTLAEERSQPMKRDFLKTTSFAALHFCVAFSVAYALTGSVKVATGVGLIEPLVNTFAFYLHERAWRRFEGAGGRSRQSRVLIDCGHVGTHRRASERVARASGSGF
jgi:uncharacterized membrane protein